jgi:hypothetical protein
VKARVVPALAWGVGEALNLAALEFKELPGGEGPEVAYWRSLPLRVAAGAMAGLALAALAHLAVRALAARRPSARGALAAVEPWLAWPAALAVGGGLGVLPQTGPVVQLTCWLAVGVLALRWAWQREAAPRAEGEAGALPWLFFGSGVAALIYQVVWQRTLFALVGVNVESTTLVVSIFMLGLGLGGLAGGWLSTRLPGRAAQLFLAVEVGVGLYATVSLALLQWVGRTFVRSSLPVTALVIALVLLVPTGLMGATLPILVAHVERRLAAVGRSVALLYGINTLGSAFACFLTVDLLFVWFGQSGAVAFAAACNLLVGALVFRFIRRSQGVAA